MDSRVRQWLSLVAIIWLQSFNGTNFNFPAYSSQLKHKLSMSQFQLIGLAFASDAAKFFAFFPGLLALTYLPLPAILFIGSILSFLGYGLQFFFIIHRFHSPSYWQFLFLSAIAGNSFCWINTVCNIIAVRNFSSNRHLAVGVSSSYQGLSANIYTSIVHSISTTKPQIFLLFNSILPMGVSVLVFSMARVLNVGEDRGGMKVGFGVIFVITIATGVYSVVTNVISKKLSPSSNLVGTLVFLILPLVVAGAEKVKELITRRVGSENVGGKDVEKGEVSCVNDPKMRTIEDIGALEIVKRVNFWLYFGVYLFGATMGLAFLNNLAQIAESRGISDVSFVVTLMSTFSFFGRLTPSLADFFLSRSKYIRSRPGWLVALMVPMCIAFFLLSCPSDWSLYLSTAIIGVCTGAITTISISLTVDLFGEQNFSINHNIVVANIPLGSFVYGYLAAIVYNSHTLSDDGKCMGIVCYRVTFLLWGAFSCLGTFLAIVLFARTRSFYSIESPNEENSK